MAGRYRLQSGVRVDLGRDIGPTFDYAGRPNPDRGLAASPQRPASSGPLRSSMKGQSQQGLKRKSVSFKHVPPSAREILEEQQQQQGECIEV